MTTRVDRIVSTKVAAILFLVGMLAACGKVDTDVALPTIGEQSVMRDPLEQIVVHLRSADAETRQQAATRLEELAREGITIDEAHRLLQAAAGKWPTNDVIDASDVLVAAALSVEGSYWNLIVESFPQYSERARWRIVQRLVERHGVDAAGTYVELVERYAADGMVPPAPLDGFLESSEATQFLVPELLHYARANELGYQLHLLALRAVQSGLVSTSDLAPFADATVQLYGPMRARMRKLEQPDDDEWIWSDEYQDDRAHATLLVDLVGYMEGRGVARALNDALASRDPRVQYFAVMAGIRQGQFPPPEVIESIAASPEMRNWLYDGLDSVGQGIRFPRRFATQEALAESNMVDWLIYPTELGRVPHEIELMETFDSDDGRERYYLFRFRTHEPHWAAEKGWMAGLSGPFAIADMPITRAGGSTFSTFTPWDENTPRGHFELITDLLEDSWKQRAAEVESGDDA